MQNTWHHVAQGNQPKHTTGKKTRKSYQAGGLRATQKDQIGSTCKVWQSVLAVDLDDPVVSLQLDALPLGLPHDGAVWLHALHANAGGALASGNIPGRGRTVSGPDFQKSLQNQKANIKAGAGLFGRWLEDSDRPSFSFPRVTWTLCTVGRSKTSSKSVLVCVLIRSSDACGDRPFT